MYVLPFSQKKKSPPGRDRRIDRTIVDWEGGFTWKNSGARGEDSGKWNPGREFRVSLISSAVTNWAINGRKAINLVVGSLERPGLGQRENPSSL